MAFSLASKSACSAVCCSPGAQRVSRRPAVRAAGVSPSVQRVVVNHGLVCHCQAPPEQQERCCGEGDPLSWEELTEVLKRTGDVALDGSDALETSAGLIMATKELLEEAGLVWKLQRKDDIVQLFYLSSQEAAPTAAALAPRKEITALRSKAALREFVLGALAAGMVEDADANFDNKPAMLQTLPPCTLYWHKSLPVDTADFNTKKLIVPFTEDRALFDYMLNSSVGFALFKKAT